MANEFKSSGASYVCISMNNVPSCLSHNFFLFYAGHGCSLNRNG